MHPPDDPPINSPAWWERYFVESWAANGGPAQTRHFMRRLIDELPDAERGLLAEPSTTLLDWGCAQGDGVDELASAFPGARVSGLDAAQSAIDACRRRFPRHDFLLPERGRIPRAFDVVICSNCLEHFPEPVTVAAELARAVTRRLILLVPFDESPLCPSHVLRLDELSFPDRIVDLERTTSKVIDVDRRIWDGQQLLLVYAPLSAPR